MNKQQSDKELCSQKLLHAFAEAERPGEDEIVCDGSLEGQELRQALRGKKWDELDGEFLNRHAIQGLWLLEPAGFRYFLPAFLLCLVKDFEACFDLAEETVDTLVYPLTLQRIRHPDAHAVGECADVYTFVCRMQGFDLARVEAITAFLQYICEYHLSEFTHNEPQYALEEYWLERLETEKRKERRLTVAWGFMAALADI
jgi:hypothetical protein